MQWRAPRATRQCLGGSREGAAREANYSSSSRNGSASQAISIAATMRLASESGRGELRLLLLLRHGDRLAALGHDEGENLGRLGQACIGRNGVQLTRRLVEGLAFGQDGFGTLIELELVRPLQHVAENVMPGVAMRCRAVAGRDVERDHDDFAAGKFRDRLLQQRRDFGGGRLLLRDGGRKRARAQHRDQRYGEMERAAWSSHDRLLLSFPIWKRGCQKGPVAPTAGGTYGDITGARLWRVPCFPPVIYGRRSPARAIPVRAGTGLPHRRSRRVRSRRSPPPCGRRGRACGRRAPPGGYWASPSPRRGAVPARSPIRRDAG